MSEENLAHGYVSAPPPVFHRPIPMGTRVKVPKHYHTCEHDIWGQVQGVASTMVIWMYIILLDEPMEDTPVGTIRALVVNGSELEDEDGNNWRIYV